MRFSLLLAAVAANTKHTLAYPGMDKTLMYIKHQARQSDSESAPSDALLGDLADLSDGELTRTGRAVRDILTGEVSAQNVDSSYSLGVPSSNSLLCSLDPCCPWKHIGDELAEAMVGDAGRCNDLARASIRLAFHDAAAWSVDSGGTGADGSIALTDECDWKPENAGLADVCGQFRAWHEKFNSEEFLGWSRRGDNTIPMADLVQFAGTVGTVSCPQGPRIRTFVGRKDNAEAPPRGLLPSPFDSADKLIDMFANKTISAAGLVALMGAHSTSQQRAVDPDRAGDPQDSTPGVWDVRYFNETLSDDTPETVFKFQSDINLAKDSRTKEAWEGYTLEDGQAEWDKAYSAEFVRMSLLGVPDINSMTECTKSLPEYTGSSFESPDQSLLEKFLRGLLEETEEAKEALLQGDLIPEDAE